MGIVAALMNAASGKMNTRVSRPPFLFSGGRQSAVRTSYDPRTNPVDGVHGRAATTHRGLNAWRRQPVRSNGHAARPRCNILALLCVARVCALFISVLVCAPLFLSRY